MGKKSIGRRMRRLANHELLAGDESSPAPISLDRDREIKLVVLRLDR